MSRDNPEDLTTEEIIDELVEVVAAELDEEQLNDFTKLTSELVTRTEGA